jgi:protein involved in polysaccharide export with SLBB domain
MTRVAAPFGVIAVAIFIGCVDPDHKGQQARVEKLTVGVGGDVDRHGKVRLSPPFTIEHAIQEAGGFNQWEKKFNKNVTVWHEDGSNSHVERKDYPSFQLRDGDVVAVPRHD